MAAKVVISYSSEAEREAVIARLAPLVKRIKYQPKKPNSPYYRAYVDLCLPGKRDTISSR